MMLEWMLENAKRWASKIHEDGDASWEEKLEELKELREHVSDLIGAIREDINRGR